MTTNRTDYTNGLTSILLPNEFRCSLSSTRAHTHTHKTKQNNSNKKPQLFLLQQFPYAGTENKKEPSVTFMNDRGNPWPLSLGHTGSLKVSQNVNLIKTLLFFILGCGTGERSRWKLGEKKSGQPL